MDSIGITIRIERITHLSEELIPQFNTLRDKGTEWEENEGKKFLQNRENALLFAFVDNKVVGFLTAHRLQRLDKKKAEILIYEISVAADFRQMGIGKAFIKKIRDWAKEVQADEVWVLTNKSNIAAMALYKSMGGTIEREDEQMFTFKIN